jgi:hypothetical protein
MTNVALREHEDRSEYLQMRIHNLRESIDHWMSVVRMLADGEIGPDHSMVRRAFDGPSRLSCESGAAKSKGSIE